MVDVRKGMPSSVVARRIRTALRKPVWGARRHDHYACRLAPRPEWAQARDSRLVCADGGTLDPTSTHGKNVDEAKSIEIAGWDYPKQLAERLFSVVVHGDSVGSKTVRRALSHWLTDMELVSAGSLAEKDGYIGYEES